MNVFILATCRKPELLPFTTLVFDTLRIGFPTATIGVYLNNLDAETSKVIIGLADKVQAGTKNTNTIHHEWIESLVSTEQEPFFIVDTDVIFYSNFENYNFAESLAGYRIPEWKDDFSGAITRARLHPSLLYIDPVAVRAAIDKFKELIPDTPFTPKVNLFHPICLPFKRRWYFNDTCSLLYQAIGGQSFTDEQKNAYCHFEFGTIPDVVLPRLPTAHATAMMERRLAILNNPALGRGAWREQEEYRNGKRV